MWERACSRRGRCSRWNFCVRNIAFASKRASTSFCMTRLDAHRSESDPVASLQLPQLPQVRFDDGYRADESAQAGSVRPEDYRHVAGEIHRADRIRVVVNVGRVQPRLTAIGTHPFGFGADQAHAGAAGVEMHFPVGREKPFDVRFGEVFRGGMRAVNDPHPAHVCQRSSASSAIRCPALRSTRGAMCSTSPARSARPP